jgi:hypothetical protein
MAGGVMQLAPGLTEELLGGLIRRAGRDDYPRFEEQLRSSHYCARPVLLVGHTETCDANGHRSMWSTRGEPDGVLRKACGNRREAVCPQCAERYRQDAYHLIAAGLRGGKGVPDMIADHPAVFVTLTAPSFGPVHARPLGPDGEPRRCRPRRDAPTCSHGARIACGGVHDQADPCLGEPLCSECFDRRAALVWNNTLPKLWQRTTTYLPRTLAFLSNRTQARLHQLVRFNYVKVAEYQRRGLVHLHVLIRLDRAMPKYRADELRPPTSSFTTELLERAVRATIETVDAPVGDELGGGRIRWGSELDVRRVDHGQARGEIAGYLAKYATKSTEQAGGVLHRVTEHQIDALPVRAHVRAYLRAAFELNADPALADRRFGRYAHAFGYRGHCLTQSRRYSTTFKARREAREAHVHEQLLTRSKDAGQRALAAAVERWSSYRVVGHGHFTAADAYLARSAAARAREQREAAREALAMEVNSGGRW